MTAPLNNLHPTDNPCLELLRDLSAGFRDHAAAVEAEANAASKAANDWDDAPAWQRLGPKANRGDIIRQGWQLGREAAWRHWYLATWQHRPLVLCATEQVAVGLRRLVIGAA